MAVEIERIKMISKPTHFNNSTVRPKELILTSSQISIAQLRQLVQTERKITAEIIELIREIDQKRYYLDYGHTSMFSFLVKEMGYTPSAVMRRIDAARLMREIPELQNDLKSGAINLSQVSMLAQAVRQKQKEIKGSQKKNAFKEIGVSQRQVSTETKSVLLEKVKSQDLIATQKIIAQGLDLKVQAYEKKSYQKDESVRWEVIFTKEQLQDLERVKELISHQYPNPTMSEVFSFLAKQFLNRKDPIRQKSKEKTGVKESKESNCIETAYAAPVVQARQVTEDAVAMISKDEVKLEHRQARRQTGPRYISQKIKQQIFKRDQCCQWTQETINAKGEITKTKCGSKFQLQIDHIKPKWQDGANNPANLQLLCSTHNKLKYQYEIIGKA